MGLKKIGGVWFEWDDRKSDKNYDKRKFDFEAAVEAFFDEHAVLGDNMDWQAEKRWQLIGKIPVTGVIVVVYTIRLFEDSDEEIYRIISARRAESAELKEYFGESAGV